MKWTPDDVVRVLTALASVIGAIAGCIAAWRGVANGTKLAQVSAKADSIHDKISDKGTE